MNILIISQYFWPESFRINDFAQRLKQAGHEISVLTGIPNYPQGSFYPGYGILKKNRVEHYNGITIRRVPLVSRGKGKGLRLMFNYLSFAFFASLLGPWFCRDNYDAILVFMPSPVTVGLPAIVLKKIRKIPILFWTQDLWPDTLIAVNAVKSHRILKLIEKLTTFIYKNCNLILVQSKAFIPAIERLGIPRNKIHYFPNAAEEFYKSTIDVMNIPENIKLPEGFCIVYAGNIGTAQSFETVIKAARLLKNISTIRWVIIGDGRRKAWLKEQIAVYKLENTVILMDFKPTETMPYYFKLADLLLVSLKKDPVFALTIPSKVQSYLACGKPILASLDGETARMLVESGAGLVSPAEDAESLADNVLNMYHAPREIREAMGLKGRNYFEQHFEMDKLIKQIENWMLQIINIGK